MNKKKKTKAQRSNYQKYFPMIIFISILFMSVGYAVINSINLNIEGEVISKEQSGVYITEIDLLTNTDADVTNSKINNVYQTMIDSKIVLSKTNASSSITYQIKLYNKSSKNSYYLGHEYAPDFYDNTDITYEINGISVGEYISPNSYKIITIKYYYKNNQLSSKSNELNSYINLNFEEYKVTFHKLDTQLVSTNNPTINLIVSNNGTYDVTGKITLNGNAIIDSITIKKGTKYQIISIDTTSMLNTLSSDTLNLLNFEVISPYSYIDQSIGVFQKSLALVSIINIETYINGVLQSNTGNIYNSENMIIVDNKCANLAYQYKITVKNNSISDSYKMRNINDLVNSDSNYTYTSSIDLADGIILKPSKELEFTLDYTYTNSTSKHVQALSFEFKWHYTFAAVEEQVISLSTPETNTDNAYGDFQAVTANSTFYNDYCTYTECYSGNNGKLEYDEKNGLVLDEDNTILTLTIDQSMSVTDEYTLYTTLKADTSQYGIPGGSFPATVIAISEANTKYLNWFGFYKNYLQIYSYYNGTAKGNITKDQKSTGFISFNVSKYSNQIINLQIVATRGANTKIYINGEYVTSFVSGTTAVDYKFATIGDLRTGRGLKFTGTIYDLALYNKALTEEEVQTNWEYADTRWQITS